jgi:hypothetical protein
MHPRPRSNRGPGGTRGIIHEDQRAAPQQSGACVLPIGFNDQCDVMVALATLGTGDQDSLEPAVLAFPQQRADGALDKVAA